MVMCGPLTNQKHGNHIKMYETGIDWNFGNKLFLFISSDSCHKKMLLITKYSLKGIFSDCNNIFLWHESEVTGPKQTQKQKQNNKKKKKNLRLLPKFQLIQFT